MNWSKVQKSFEESMLKWNNVYFRDNGVDKRLVYLEKTHNMKCIICLYESNEKHYFVYNSSLGKDECEDCGYILE